MGETNKAHERRKKEGWYDKYIKNPGLDVGGGTDPLDPKNFFLWDYEWEIDSRGVSVSKKNDRNAQTLNGLANNSFLTVYASHILEHLEDPVEALRNWWRVLMTNGRLIVCVPHRDLYEKKKEKPSRWNPHTRWDGGGHLTFWLPDRDEAPDTLSFDRVLKEALPNAIREDFKILDAGYDYSLPEDVHPVGEYAIEVILRKP